MNKLLRIVLDRLVVRGRLSVVDADGRTHEFGDGTGEHVTLEIADRKTELRLLANPELAFGEAYMNGDVRMRRGSIYDALMLVLQRDPVHIAPILVGAYRARRYMMRRLRQWNVGRRAKRNVAHHYDLDSRLYDLFLDADRQYSCGYFERPDVSLEEAQLAKKRHLAAKLAIEPGQRVLDIGSGWGGLGIYLAENCGCEVKGVTLSEEQLSLSRRRASERGLDGRVRFELEDYRKVEGRFDRIVSVGMFEHVGVNHFRTFFDTVRDRLTDDGVAVIHTIGRTSPPGSTNPWIAKYIFPGGYIPALSEILRAIEPTGLIVTDVEILRVHYAETLRAWRERFLERRDEAEALYDERFCRMWEFYLAGSETSFRNEGMVVFQIQLSKKLEALPMTRDYIGETERELRRRDDSVSRSHAAE